MTVRLGNQEFDSVVYDADGDVLYLHKGDPVPAAETVPTSDGHAVSFDDVGEVIGITVVNVKWLVERDGQITITIPGRFQASSSDLLPALTG